MAAKYLKISLSSIVVTSSCSERMGKFVSQSCAIVNPSYDIISFIFLEDVHITPLKLKI
jgi:hypothetical protein